jgi:hypothetical protein
VDFAVERCNVSESLVGQMMRFEIMPGNLDVVEFGGVLLRIPVNSISRSGQSDQLDAGA